MENIFTVIKKNIGTTIGLLVLMVVVLFFGMALVSFQDFGGTMSSNSISYDSSYNSGFASDKSERQIVQNGRISLETQNYDSSKQSIVDTSNSFEAIILTNNERVDNSGYRYLSLGVKVKSDQLELYMNTLNEFGEIQNFNIYSYDVTQKSLDYTQRIVRYESQLVKYETMLTRPSITIAEEIDLNKRIDEIEVELFNLQNRNGNLDESISYSDVSITLSEKKSLLTDVNFIGFKEAFKGFISSLNGALWFIVYVFGFILPLAAVYSIYSFGKRLFSKK